MAPFEGALCAPPGPQSDSSQAPGEPTPHCCEPKRLCMAGVAAVRLRFAFHTMCCLPEHSDLCDGWPHHRPCVCSARPNIAARDYYRRPCSLVWAIE